MIGVDNSVMGTKLSLQSHVVFFSLRNSSYFWNYEMGFGMGGCLYKEVFVSAPSCFEYLLKKRPSTLSFTTLKIYPDF